MTISGHEADMLTDRSLLDLLRDALNNLYDPNRLQRNPLIEHLGLAEEENAPDALQHVLTDTIASLEPPASVPSHSRAWRIYDLLFCRYVQQLRVKAVAEQLGVSVRHLRREQHDALEALAQRLQAKYHLVQNVHDTGDIHTQQGPSVSEELSWLMNAALEQPAHLKPSLDEAQHLLQPLVNENRIRLELQVPDDVPDLAVHHVALNQILLSLLSLAVAHSTGGHVTVTVRPLRRSVLLEMNGARFFTDSSPISDDEGASLAIAKEMVELSGGSLTVKDSAREFNATLILPAYERLLVLVIDDNADTLKLFLHFVSGTRYRMVGTQDPQQALELVQQWHPQIVVLDIMMPRVDGWKVLADLRQRIITGYLPVIVCSVVPQEKLTLLQGANAFLRKPVTRKAFLAALDQQVALMEPESD